MSAPFTPFVELDGNPAPERLAGGSFSTRDGKQLRYAIARPEGPSRGTVLILQGRNEAIEKYFETIDDLTRRGFTAAIFDWRGQGGSQRHLRNASKGHIDSIDTYVSDLEGIIEDVVVRNCRAPYVILAHSMGGLVALSAIPRLVGRIERIVVSAPLVALADGRPGTGPISILARAMALTGFGRVALRRLKRGGVTGSLETNPLTSDAARFERNRMLVEKAPHLFVGSLTASWLSASFQAMRRLEDSDFIAGLHIPTLIVTAGADRVVRSASAERLAWRMRSGHVLSIPGARHELLQEADLYREPFLAAFEGFVASLMPREANTAPLVPVLQEADLTP